MSEQPKIHVIFRKEEVDSERLEDSVAIVIDILLATSTIAAALQNGAKEIIPVLNGEEAYTVAQTLPEGTYLLSGEKDGYTIEGFVSASPLEIIPKVNGKALIFSTTNGTVAVRKSARAAAVYTSALLNARAVARHVALHHSQQTVVVICSGSKGAFALEDFYGAGCLVERLQSFANGQWQLTDAAQAALDYYQHYPQKAEHCLAQSGVGRFLGALGYGVANAFAAQTDALQVVPVLSGGRLTNLVAQ